ncbi:MAG: nuclear transport factor 2 family protein [Phycisphaerales bacterium]|nr:nuclear transport factor 2 family protein [Phycisphaerales bacterium]
MIHSIAAALISLVMGFGANQPHPEMPQGHPQPEGVPSGHPDIVERENDPEIVEPPEADPADVASIDAIVGAYYDSLSGPKGEERDWDRLRSIFQPMARLVAARPVRGDHSGIWVMELEEFIAFNKSVMERGGFFEREISRKTETFGNIAHVWSTYESRRAASDPEPYSRGIYSVQLLRDGDRWWIVSVYWDYERADSPIPPAYLP